MKTIKVTLVLCDNTEQSVDVGVGKDIACVKIPNATTLMVVNGNKPIATKTSTPKVRKKARKKTGRKTHRHLSDAEKRQLWTDYVNLPTNAQGNRRAKGAVEMLAKKYSVHACTVHRIGGGPKP